MKKTSQVTAIIFIYLNLFSYSQNLDSIINIFKNDKLNDTIRLNAIHSIAKNYILFNPDSSIVFAKQELKLAKESDHKKYQAKAYNLIGIAFNTKNNYPAAIDNYIKALNIYENINYKTGIGYCYTNIGVVYNSQKNYQKAIEYFFKALRLARESHDLNAEAGCLG